MKGKAHKVREGKERVTMREGRKKWEGKGRNCVWKGWKRVGTVSGKGLRREGREGFEEGREGRV